MTVDAQIKKAFEDEGMTPEQIAEDQGFDVTAIKAKLMQISSKYRQACGAEKEEVVDGLNFTNQQLESVNRVIYETALAAEYPDGSVDFKTRLTAATYIRDDKKGRKEVARQMAGNQFNIFNLNQALEQARMGASKVIHQITNKNGNNGHGEMIEA